MNSNNHPASRVHRLSALLFGLLILLFGGGCATISLITEVTRDETGDHADFTARIEVDPGVAQAAGYEPSDFTEPPKGLHSAWTYEGNADEHTMIFRRHFATLDELSQLPAEMRKLGDEFTLNLVQAMAITATQASTTGVDYTFDATIVIPEPGDSTSSVQVCNASEQDWVEFISCSADYEFEASLEEAIEMAGPPEIEVEVILPGALRTWQMNYQDMGTRLDEGRVIWELDPLKAGTYLIRATTVPLPGSESAEALLEEALSDDIGYQGLTTIAGIDPARTRVSANRAVALTGALRRRLPADLPKDISFQILSPFYRAHVLAGILDAKGKPVFPTFSAMSRVITRLAVNAGTNEDARLALGRLVELMISMESKRLEEKAAQ